MSLFDDVGLLAAEQLETSVGPYIALASYKRLLAGPSEVRARAALGALRCAVSLSDDAEVSALCGPWATAREATRSATPLAAQLLRDGKAPLAARLAKAEETRAPRALTAYVRLRAEEHAGLIEPALAVGRWEELSRRAAVEGDASVSTHAGAHFVAAALQRARDDADAEIPRERLVEVAVASSLDLVPPALRLSLLRARLLSTSRFQRAGALSALEELGRHGDAPLRLEVARLAARHLDGMMLQLDAIELDRIGAALKLLPDGEARTSALLRLAAFVRVIAASKGPVAERAGRVDAALRGMAERSPAAARALALARTAEERGFEGGRPAPTDASPHARLAWLAFEVRVARAHRDGAAADRALHEATAILGPDVAVPPIAWSAALGAARGSKGLGRRAGCHFLDRALARTLSLPPFPLTTVAATLSVAGEPAASFRALVEAARWKEPGAEALLGVEKRREAYAALARGDRAGAMSLFSTARQLLAAPVGSS